MRWFKLVAISIGISLLWTTTAYAWTNVSVASKARTHCQLEDLLEFVMNKSNSDAVVDAQLAYDVTQMLKDSSDLTAINVEVPGFDKKLMDALRPLVREHRDNLLPQYRDELRQFYSNNFTVSEVEDLCIFYKLSTDGKLTNNIKDFDIDNNALEVIRRNSADSLTDNERAQTSQFLATSAGRKMTQLRDQFYAISRKWAEHPIEPELDRRMDRAIAALITEHSAALQKSRRQ